MAVEGWAIVELMGHRQRAGRITEEEVCAAKMLRVDIPTGDGGFVTEYYGGASIYALRPVTEEIARRYAEDIGAPRPAEPVRYRLPPPAGGADDDDASFEGAGENGEDLFPF